MANELTSLEDALNKIETLASGHRDTFDDAMTPDFALDLVAQVRERLAPKLPEPQYVCENCDTSKEHHNPECQQPDWRCVNPSALPVEGELPDLDFSCATTRMMAERDVNLYGDDMLRGLAIERTEKLTLRERQLLASHARERALEAQLASINDELNAYKEWAVDTKRLTRQIDVAMHGAENAAPQASLCDLVGPAENLRKALATSQADTRAECLKECANIAFAPDFPRAPEGSNQQAFNAGLGEYRRRILALAETGR